jgi:hypothetical protein
MFRRLESGLKRSWTGQPLEQQAADGSMGHGMGGVYLRLGGW